MTSFRVLYHRQTKRDCDMEQDLSHGLHHSYTNSHINPKYESFQVSHSKLFF